MDDVRIGDARKSRGLVIRQERLEDAVGRVHKIEHESVGLAGVRPVEP